ncbi:putative protein [Vanrija pseudolonga]|uniref:Purtative protein n=1 Tax=Vanrija pseudolonga TaxID=143232 RepID=A0AAF1BNV2_9TREE|nr:purtative protein [Vanrija pseudolonga]
MSYGHYPPPQQHGGPANYYHQQPSPQAPHDPFRAWYAQQLAGLTFNSRPMIQNLSIEAQNRQHEGNWPAMEAIVQEIEDAILRAPPQGKLPLLYLIDSISKNIGPPFTDTLLPPILPQLYLATYRQVDGVTKSKMADLVRLWRTGGPNGTELYPPAMREAVERDMFGGSAPLTQQSVQTMLKEFLREKEEEMSREWTQQRGKTVNTLVNLDKILTNTRVSARELADISDRIQAMKGGQPAPAAAPVFSPTSSSYTPRQVAPPPAPPVHRQPPPPQPPQQQYGGQGRWGGNSPYGAGAGYPPPQPQNYPPPPQQNLAPPQPTPAPVAIPAIPVNVSDLLSKLTSSGILSQPRTPEPSVVAKPQKSGLEKYEDMVLAFNIQVDHFDLSRVGIPMGHLPVRCTQCGMRFAENDAKYQAHLDWHFRRNRKERESAGRGGHRRWLPRADEWVNDNAEAGPSSPTKPESAALPETLSSDKIAALKRKWVPVPADPVKAAKPCPIDKEKFESVYSEEEEEWVFMNAVDVNGTIYHATCLAEKKASNVAQRVLNRDAARASSKSPAPGTPEPEATPAPSPGTKRKAEVDDTEDDAKRVKVETGDDDAVAVAESGPDEGMDVGDGGASGVNGADDDVNIKVEVEEAAVAEAPAPAPVQQDAAEALETVAAEVAEPTAE